MVLYTDLIFQLPSALTISSATQVRGSDSIGYEICGYAAKDHSKINEGEVKDYSVGATELKLTGTIYARLVKR